MTSKTFDRGIERLKCDPVSSQMRASYVPDAPRDRFSGPVGHRSGYKISTAVSASLQSDSVDPTRRSPGVFHSLGVGMEASEARREDGVSSADDYENLPNCAQMFASQPLLHLDHLQSLLRRVEQAPETVPSGNFFSRRRSRRSDGPSQTTWKPPRPLGEAASRSPVTAEKNREWGMWLTVVLRDAELKIG